MRFQWDFMGFNGFCDIPGYSIVGYNRLFFWGDRMGNWRYKPSTLCDGWETGMAGRFQTFLRGLHGDFSENH